MKLLLVVLGVAVASGVAETALRIVDYGPRYEMLGFVLQLDDEVLFRLVPGGETEINSEGYRDIEHPEDPGGRKRVLVLGDSLVMGYNVALEDTLPRALGRELGEGWEVRNQGVYGYGPDQSFLRLRDEGLALEPAWVVLVLFPPNDFLDLVKNERVRPGPDGPQWLRDHPVRRALPVLRLVGLLRAGWTGSALPAEEGEELFFRLFADGFDLRHQEGDPQVRWKTEMLRQLLAEYRDLLTEREVRFLVVSVPSWEGFATPDLFVARGLPAERIFVHEDRAAAICRGLAIPLLDLREVFRAEMGAAAFDPEDHHLSVAGNRLAARAVAERMLAAEAASAERPRADWIFQ